MSSTAVFKSASQALHVSYIIQNMPATSQSPTAAVINRLKRELAPWDGIQTDHTATVNWGSLNPLEVRAQCAQVVSMVNHLGHEAERAACRAIYGHQVEKANGVRSMASYLEPVIGRGTDFCLYVAWHVFMRPEQRQGVTQRDIAEQFGVSLRTVEGDCSKMRKYGVSLHKRALDGLTDRFMRGGLIPDPEEVAV
ncbi:HTH domain-containing protein [Xenophilus sp. Marseille-Q4582]|uniref:HTH domain-containing protein n=1 Tax=Xenophilus sp. Marseille-Q4582 TaxID=2866600 RepID=UPI001CE4643D|nr:HTH domain-containing protein [Xenophilus sp. Marseille-Q4582]